MGETMKEFNEKRVYMTMEISITCKEEIERIIKNKEISFNEFINQAIKNNFKENLNKINIYKREEGKKGSKLKYEYIKVYMTLFLILLKNIIFLLQK